MGGSTREAVGSLLALAAYGGVPRDGGLPLGRCEREEDGHEDGEESDHLPRAQASSLSAGGLRYGARYGRKEARAEGRGLMRISKRDFDVECL